jgi:hypothetical protein
MGSGWRCGGGGGVSGMCRAKLDVEVWGSSPPIVYLLNIRNTASKAFLILLFLWGIRDKTYERINVGYARIRYKYPPFPWTEIHPVCSHHFTGDLKISSTNYKNIELPP